jgi:hypothetical protein
MRAATVRTVSLSAFRCETSTANKAACVPFLNVVNRCLGCKAPISCVPLLVLNSHHAKTTWRRLLGVRIMAARAQWTIGAALILVAASVQEQPGPQVPAQFHETVLAGRLGFELYLPEPAWRTLTAHSLGIPSALLDDKVHAAVNAMIERGIRDRRLPCPRQWLLSEIGPADIGGMLLVGVCATPEEIRAVDDDRAG